MRKLNSCLASTGLRASSNVRVHGIPPRPESDVPGIAVINIVSFCDDDDCVPTICLS